MAPSYGSQLLVIFLKTNYFNYVKSGVGIMGWGQSKTLVQRAVCNMYFSLLLLFAVLLYTEEEISDLQSIVSMLLCRALERSNNPYLEPIMEPGVSKDQKEFLSMCV